MKNRVRKKSIHIYVTDEEYELISHKQQLSSHTNLSEYARKMLVDGYIINVDFATLKSLIHEISKIGTNINQIAKRANEARNLSSTDMNNFIKDYSSLKQVVNEAINKISQE